jgi:APA family basic amino acid/polyamine antiporter
MPEGKGQSTALPGKGSPSSYVGRLGPFSGTMMVVGGIIGSGIFLNPAIVVERVRTIELTLAVWVLGGVIALIGALVFAELGARRPVAGGGYVYLRDAYGRLPAFLYAWTLLLVIATGAIAAVAVTFASYTAALLGLGTHARVPLAIAAILLLSAINYVGVKPGALTQNVLTLLKLGALAFLIVVGLTATQPPLELAPLPPLTGGSFVLAVGAALVPVLFAYGGWQQTNFIAEELIEPERNLPRALLAGVLIVVLVYLLANLAYLSTLGISGLARSSAPAADAMGLLLGPPGRSLIAAGIAISTFGFLNLVILVSPRVYRAMASDGLFFPSLARLHPRYRTPTAAILFQGGWAIILTLTGRYGDLLDYVVFGDWIFFGSTASTLFIFRARERSGLETAHLRFRMPAFPIAPIIFIVAAIYVVVGSIASNPANALKGSALMALGVPVYLYWDRRRGGKGGKSGRGGSLNLPPFPPFPLFPPFNGGSQAYRSTPRSLRPRPRPPGTPPDTCGSARRSRRLPAARSRVRGARSTGCRRTRQ